MKDLYTEEEFATILEIARTSLSDGMEFYRIADELDMNDKEMADIQNKINQTLDQN